LFYDAAAEIATSADQPGFLFGFPVDRKLTLDTISKQWGGRVRLTFELAGAWSVKEYGF